MAAVDDVVRRAEDLGARCLLPTDAQYDAERVLFNRMHDLRPLAIIQTRRRATVAEVLKVAEHAGVNVTVRGGGHHIAGFGSTDNGVVLDFSPFRRVRVDAERGRVYVEPGARLRDVDHALTRRGYVIPTGTVSDTGIAGLTLGGGIGWLIGQYGLTCDHLIGADLILANGDFLRVSEVKHEDVLWGLRGGGGGLGVVTSFVYRLRRLPRITVGQATVALSGASAAMRRLARFLSEECPATLTTAISFGQYQDETRLEVEFCLVGDSEEPLVALAAALGKAEWRIDPDTDFAKWQQHHDHRYAEPCRGYWKAHYGPGLPKAVTDGLVHQATEGIPAGSQILVEHLHGAIHDLGVDASAFPLRSASFGVLASARWTSPSQDSRRTKWVRDVASVVEQAGMLDPYTNYSSSDDHRAHESLSSLADGRLRDLKATLDPGNMFSRNHLSTSPSAGS